MKRQFCDQAKDSELTDDDALECSYSQPLINTCCRKCKSCYGKSGSINPRQSDVALRLKEKSKKKKEAAEKEVNQSALKDTCKNGQTQRASEEMNSDDLDEYIAISQTAGSGGKTKLRSSSNNSSISADFDENKCTLKTDCKCKSCQKIQKLGEELIAEEESSKKKKAKKKKKKNGKKNQDTVEEDNEDDDTKVKPETEDEDSHEHVNSGSRNSNSVDPTSVDINQWIKVKNKNTANTHNLKNSISKTSLSSRSSLSSGYTLVASENHDQKTEMESNGFKLVGGKDNTEKRKGPTLEGVTKDLESMIITDLKNSPTATEKARLLSIDANLAYLRGELSDAIHLISQSIECDSKSPEYFINRSFYYEKSKNYSSALNDAEKAIKLEEVNENFLEYSLYRKAKALAGLNRFEIVESVLKSITKVLSAKCKNDVQAYNSFVIVIEKELMINRLKKLVSANYTLPLARLYALKFGSIKAAIAAIGDNIRLLDDANADSLDLKLHLQLINAQFQKNASTDSSVKDSKLLALIRASHPPQLSASQHRRISNKSSANQDLWNFNENDEESSSGDRPHLLLRDFCDTGGTQKIDEEAFLSQYDDDDDDSEIYFSDEDEYEMVYSNPDKWNEPKDILVNTGNAHYFTDELREPINSNGQKALWIGNVSPECSQNLVSHVFMKFGSVTFCNIFPNERSNEIAYLLLHYDNDISPRLVTTYFKDQVVPKISKDNHPLIIRFRNKNDKGEEGGDGGGGGVLNASNNNIPKTALNPASPQSPSHHHHPHQPYHLSALTSSANKQPLPQECYYWRTTGCDRDRCYFKHIPAHKSIDKQPWMRRKN